MFGIARGKIEIFIHKFWIIDSDNKVFHRQKKHLDKLIFLLIFSTDKNLMKCKFNISYKYQMSFPFSRHNVSLISNFFSVEQIRVFSLLAIDFNTTQLQVSFNF